MTDPYVKFQQHSAFGQTPGIARIALDNLGITLLPWPAVSPDPNPIENLWHVLKRRAVNTYRTEPKSNDELWARIREQILN